MDIFKLIEIAKSKKASDLHLSANSPPMIRINGLLELADENIILTETEIQKVFGGLSSSNEMERFGRNREIDFSYSQADGTRLRCSVTSQRGLMSMTIRIVSPKIPDIDELELPPIFKKFALMEKGLVIVSGPTGSGKTTSQAAMIQYINRNKAKHILTFEDPIEYSHPNVKSRVTQRGLGEDTISMAEALKHALRLDPDVIVVGEMRDSETAAAVISLAETGHLVISTSHAPYAAQTVERIIDLFPPEQRYMAQMRLASLLSVVLCQILVPRIDGKTRIAAVEIMQVSGAIRNLIREGKITLLANAIRDYRQNGSTTMDEALVDLYHRNLISLATVNTYCHEKDEVNPLLNDMLIKTKPLNKKLEFQYK